MIYQSENQVYVYWSFFSCVTILMVRQHRFITWFALNGSVHFGGEVGRRSEGIATRVEHFGFLATIYFILFAYKYDFKGGECLRATNSGTVATLAPLFSTKPIHCILYFTTSNNCNKIENVVIVTKDFNKILIINIWV